MSKIKVNMIGQGHGGSVVTSDRGLGQNTR